MTPTWRAITGQQMSTLIRFKILENYAYIIQIENVLIFKNALATLINSAKLFEKRNSSTCDCHPNNIKLNVQGKQLFPHHAN